MPIRTTWTVVVVVEERVAAITIAALPHAVALVLVLVIAVIRSPLVPR
jgi:hypothetical protein